MNDYGIYGRHGADFVPASESFVPAAEQADNSVDMIQLDEQETIVHAQIVF